MNIIRTLKILFLFLFSGFFSAQAIGQTISQYWNTSNGLSNNWVSAIRQDSNGYIWIATQYGLNKFDGYAFQSFQYEPNNNQSLSNNWVRNMEQDSSGFFWVNAFLGGLNRLEPSTGITLRDWFYKDGSKVKIVRTFFIDDKQQIWLGSSKGFFCKHPDTSFFEKINDRIVYDIRAGKEGHLFLLAEDGVYDFSKSEKQFQKIESTHYPKIQRIFVDSNDVLWWFLEKELQGIVKKNGTWAKKSIAIKNSPLQGLFTQSPIFEDSQHRLWIGGEEGITIIEADRKTSKTVAYAAIFPKGISHGKVLCFYEDNHQNIWIGTTKGLFLQSPFTKRFALSERFPMLDDFQLVRGILQVEHDLWLASEQGLFQLNLEKQNTVPKKKLEEYSIVLLKSSDGHLYVGGKNLYKIDLTNFEVRLIPKGENSWQGGRIWSLVEDDNGRIWIGSEGMLQCFNPSNGHFDYFSKSQIPVLKDSPSQVLLIDSQKRLWAGSLYSGLYLFENINDLYSNQNTEIQRFYFDKKEQASLSNNLVVALAEGKDGAIWVATDGGLNRIDPNNFEIKRFLKKDGLIDEKIMGLLIDDAGLVWGSTAGHGIFRLNPQTDEFTFFNQKDGLLSNNFLLSAYYKNQNGILFFGSDNGLQIIDPQIIDGIQKPHIPFHFTTLNLPDSSIDLTARQKISLPHNYPSFSIEYSTLNYFQATKTEYVYQLEGIHNNWQSNGNNRAILFTGLGAGDYTLRVKAINPDLIFDEGIQTLSIKILPPWWKTFWAYASYFLIFLGVIALVYWMQLKRQLEKAEAQRLQELDAMKTRFFTNITHEFRTPLTVILGLANKLKRNSKKEIATKAQLIYRNGQQVLDLINQILEVSKLKAGKLPVEYVHGDLLQYLSYLIESFHSMAASKNIRLHFLPEAFNLFMDYDPEKIKQITYNLISNAIRFTPEGGDIYLQIKVIAHQVELIFRDTGTGIEREHLPYIFERFYQVENSEGNTGIGLSFTKELVALLDGSINVDSHLGQGTTFIISLPIRKNAQKSAQLIPIQKTEKALNHLQDLNAMHADNVPLLLLVEDNEDVLYYLVDCLKMDYRIETASDGEEGIQKAEAMIPDLIISDIMMPKKDGYALCRTLKREEKTSHIPIILLTAKVGQSAKLEGLELGADAYLYKPFEKKELLIRIKKLLEIREQLQKRFQQLAFGEQPKLESKHIEDVFVAKVRTVIEQHIGEANFGIPQLCRKLGISRVHLHRKLKALTNQSTSHFIRRIRLQKAKTLLQTTHLNVSEIAYEVGFSDPAYFSKVYSEIYGEPPNVTRK